MEQTNTKQSKAPRQNQQGMQGSGVCWPERERKRERENVLEIWNSVTTTPVSNSKRITETVGEKSNHGPLLPVAMLISVNLLSMENVFN